MAGRRRSTTLLLALLLVWAGDRTASAQTAATDPQGFLRSCSGGELVQIRLKRPPGRVITGEFASAGPDGVVIRPYRAHKDRTILYADIEEARRYQPPPVVKAVRATSPVVYGLLIAVGVLAIIVLAKTVL